MTHHINVHVPLSPVVKSLDIRRAMDEFSYARPKLAYKPITSLSYCHTHGNTQDAGEWVDESGDECCESWFDQDDPARCVMCDVYAKVPAS